MKRPGPSRPLLLFYVLVVYVLLQFSWWAYLLVKTNTQVTELQYQLLNSNIVTDAGTLSVTDLVASKESLDRELHKRWMMIVGEGLVFLVRAALN